MGLVITIALTILVLARHWLVRTGLLILTSAGVAGVLWAVLHSATALSRLTLYRNTLFVTSDYAFTGIGLGDTFTGAKVGGKLTSTSSGSTSSCTGCTATSCSSCG